MSTTSLAAEFRTSAEIAADEGLTSRFEKGIVKDSQTGWTIHEATDQRLEMLEEQPSRAIAPGGLNVPFLWNGEVFRITKAENTPDATLLEVRPPAPDFLAEIRRRIEASPFRTLTFYQGFGFICFPEDYARYQG